LKLDSRFDLDIPRRAFVDCGFVGKGESERGIEAEIDINIDRKIDR